MSANDQVDKYVTKQNKITSRDQRSGSKVD